MDHHKDSPPFQADERFLEHARNPRNQGMAAHPDGYARGVGQCGDSMEVALLVTGEVIEQIKVLPHGCIYTLVCASAMSELARGRTIEQALEMGPENVEAALGGLPEDHRHCARLAVNTLGEAIADFYSQASPVTSLRRGPEGGGS